MKIQRKALAALTLSAVMALGSVPVAEAAPKKELAAFDNTWAALNLDYGTTLLSGYLPDVYAAKSAPTKRIKEITFTYSTQTAPTNRYTFKYDKKGNLKRLTEYSHGNPDSPYYESLAYDYKYDSDGRMTGFEYSVQKKHVISAEVDTDGKGRITGYHTSNEKSGLETDVEISYKGNMVSKIVSHNNDEEQVSPGVSLYKYDEKKGPVSVVSKNLNTGAIGTKWDFSHDASGRVVSANERRGSNLNSDSQQITYDEDGYVSMISKRHAGADYTMDSRITYEAVK